jgi:hypothetical protein
MGLDSNWPAPFTSDLGDVTKIYVYIRGDYSALEGTKFDRLYNYKST